MGVAAKESAAAAGATVESTPAAAHVAAAAATLQGNINPAVLRRHEGGDESKVKAAVTELLEAAGRVKIPFAHSCVFLPSFINHVASSAVQRTSAEIECSKLSH